jgi:hypothetical protein
MSDSLSNGKLVKSNYAPQINHYAQNDEEFVVPPESFTHAPDREHKKKRVKVHSVSISETPP